MDSLNKVDLELVDKISNSVEKYIPFPFYNIIYSESQLLSVINRIKRGHFSFLTDYNRYANLETTRAMRINIKIRTRVKI